MVGWVRPAQCSIRTHICPVASRDVLVLQSFYGLHVVGGRSPFPRISFGWETGGISSDFLSRSDHCRCSSWGFTRKVIPCISGGPLPYKILRQHWAMVAPCRLRSNAMPAPLSDSADHVLICVWG